MEEKQLIKQLRGLNQIKPDRNWVSLVKKEILEKDKEQSQVLGWLFAVAKKPALVLGSIFLTGVVIFGAFFYINGNQKTSRIAIKEQASQEMLNSLANIQVSLKKINSSLDNLENNKDKKQAIAMTEVIKATAQKSEKIAGNIKNSGKSLSNQVRASLIGIGESAKELGNAANDIQIKMINSLIKDLKQRSLTKEDMARLQKAEQYYNEGKYMEAAILIQRIGN